MTSTAPIPTLGLSSNNKAELAKSVQEAFSTLGFLYVTHPDLDQISISKIFEISKVFFTQSSELEKTKCARKADNMGYVAFKAEHLDPLSSPQGDTKEAFNLGRLILQEGLPVAPKTQVIPSTLKKHLPAIYEFQETCRSICLEILNLLAISLGLSKDIFTSQHMAKEDDLSILRMLYYASQPSNPENPSGSASIRAGAHSDYGSLTLLFQESDGPTGLQVLTSSETDPTSSWKDVAVQPGAILVNIGDALEFWTGGKLKSTVHRVIQPTHPSHHHPTRFSIAYFCQPDPDAILKDVLGNSPDLLTSSRLESKGISLSETLTSREHLARRFNATYLSGPAP